MANSFNHRFVPGVKWPTNGYSYSLSFSPDGQELLTTKNNDDTVILWNPANGERTAVIPDAGPVAQFSNNSSDMFAALRPDFNGNVYLVNRDALTRKWTSKFGEAVYMAAFGFGSTRLALFRQDRYTEVLYYRDLKRNVDTAHLLPNYMGGNIVSMACCGSSDLKTVFGQADGGTFVFTLLPDTVQALSHVGSEKVTQLLWSSMDKYVYIVSGDSSGKIRIWNAGDMTWAAKDATTHCSIDRLAFCTGDASVLVVSGGRLRLYDIESAGWVSDVGLPDAGSAVAFHEATSRLAVATLNEIKIFDIAPTNALCTC